MSEGPETRLTLLVLWIGRITYVATLILLVSMMVYGTVLILRGEWRWFPKHDTFPNIPISENPISD